MARSLKTRATRRTRKVRNGSRKMKGGHKTSLGYSNLSGGKKSRRNTRKNTRRNNRKMKGGHKMPELLPATVGANVEASGEVAGVAPSASVGAEIGLTGGAKKSKANKTKKGGKRKVNGFFQAMMTAKKGGALNFSYNGKTYNRQTKGHLVYYKA